MHSVRKGAGPRIGSGRVDQMAFCTKHHKPSWSYLALNIQIGRALNFECTALKKPLSLSQFKISAPMKFAELIRVRNLREIFVRSKSNEIDKSRF